MKLRAALFILALLLPALPGAHAAPRAKTVRVAFLGPLSGPLRARTEEVLDGVRAAVELWSGSWRILDLPVELTTFDLRDRRASPKALEKDLRRAAPHLIVGAPAAGDLDALTTLARRLRVPAILVSVWEPPFSVSPDDPVFQFGGNTVDHALDAAGYTEIPFRSVKAAGLHDGTAAAESMARAYVRNLHARAKPGGVHAIPETPDEVRALLAGLAADGVETAFVCAETDGAARLLGEEERRPRLLFADGLLTPQIWCACGPGDRFLVGVNPYLVEDEPDRLRITREEEGEPPSPLAVRGYGAVSLGMRAFREAEGKPKALLAAIRALRYEQMLGTTVFTEWGQARFFRYELWEVKEGAPARIKPGYLPTRGLGTLLRHLTPDRFQLDPDGMMVLVTWGPEDESSIDEDLKNIGLSSAGYEGNIDEMAKAGVLARALSRLNRLFWRNADGTPIPGVSFRISFGTRLPRGVKRQQWWEMRIAGDDPAAGGRAVGTLALVYSTFIERTMYRGLRLDPAVNREDLDFFTGNYEWGSALERNIRNDEIRALLEGFAGAIAMTGAHEIGHLAGLSHDTSSDRSIMNVEEGGGLEPDWAEWVPDHVRLLETRLKRWTPGRRR
jgi:ABC-type branched-subunit amino acid transport system substrate-binding protein